MSKRPPTAFLFFSLLLLLFLLIAACAGKPPAPEQPSANGRDERAAGAEELLAGDPFGPVPAPRLPDGMAAAQTPADEAPSSGETHSVPYSVDCASPDDPKLADIFNKTSLLQRLADSPPTSLTGLEQRLSSSLEEGRKILHSQGYYSGTVTGSIDPQAPEAKGANKHKTLVWVRFSPGPRYALGRTSVSVAEEKRTAAPDGVEKDQKAAAAPDGAEEKRTAAPDGAEEEQTAASGKNGTDISAPAARKDGLPVSLADVGLTPGSQAEADAVLAAVDRVRDAFRNKGYPFAKVEGTRYTVDHQARTLDAEVLVNSGPFTRMGDIRTPEAPTVTPEYLEALRTWEPGAPWNQEAVDTFHDNLRQSGLFRSITLSPAKATDGGERRDVDVALLPAPERTVSGALKYDSDFGPGVQGGGEHRNLTGRGDSLRLSLPLWMDLQEFTANYRQPYFLRKDQAFIAQGRLLNQDTEAYDLQSAAASAGLERRFSPHWSGSVQASAEGGSIKDPDEPRSEYVMLGLPLGLAYDNTGSLLDASSGARVLTSVTPYTGTYNTDFEVLRTRLDAQAFLPLVGRDTLILALRGAYGSLWGADAQDVPPTVRFYSGGGGSVRGYEYQSLGPRDDDDKPLGGTSLVEVSGETRWKITPEWGVVAFVDGGMAYADAVRNFGGDLRWGAGLGLRYYTAIGPLRFDLATPLTPREDDASLQFYISIGQSF